MIIRFVCNLCGKVGQFSLQINSAGFEGKDCFVVPKEAFATIRYEAGTDGAAVNVGVEEVENNKLRVSFAWRFAIH